MEKILIEKKFVGLDCHVFDLAYVCSTNGSRRNIVCDTSLCYKICFMLENQVTKSCRRKPSKEEYIL